MPKYLGLADLVVPLNDDRWRNANDCKVFSHGHGQPTLASAVPLPAVSEGWKLRQHARLAPSQIQWIFAHPEKARMGRLPGRNAPGFSKTVGRVEAWSTLAARLNHALLRRQPRLAKARSDHRYSQVSQARRFETRL